MKLARTALIKKMRARKVYCWQAMNLYRGDNKELACVDFDNFDGEVKDKWYSFQI